MCLNHVLVVLSFSLNDSVCHITMHAQSTCAFTVPAVSSFFIKCVF